MSHRLPPVLFRELSPFGDHGGSVVLGGLMSIRPCSHCHGNVRSAYVRSERPSARHRVAITETTWSPRKAADRHDRYAGGEFARRVDERLHRPCARPVDGAARATCRMLASGARPLPGGVKSCWTNVPSSAQTLVATTCGARSACARRAETNLAGSVRSVGRSVGSASRADVAEVSVHCWWVKAKAPLSAGAVGNRWLVPPSSRLRALR